MTVTPRAGDEAPLLHCHAGCGQPELFAAFRELDGGRAPALGHPNADSRPIKSGKPKRHPGPADHRYQYLDGAGDLVATKSRWDATPEYLKDFEWPAGGVSAKDLIYGAELLTEHPEDAVLYVEGEACADAARAAGMTCTITGGAGVPSREALTVLAGRRVYLFADNDTAGAKLMHGVAANLPECKAVLWVVHFGAKPGADVVDFLAAHPEGGKLALRRLLKESMLYHAPEPVFTRDAGAASSAAGPPVASAGQEMASAVAPVVSKIKYKSAAELLEREIPDARWAIEPILPEGLAIFAGKPKIGKSWICLDWCIAVASGTVALGAYDTEPGDVLYLALEDHDRRMKARIAQVLKGGKLPADFTYVCEAYPRLDNGGLEALRDWLTTANHPRLIIIDTLKRIRAPHTANGNPYDQDSDALTGLKSLADEFHVCIVVVHHLRKAPAEEDVFDEISGTLGLTGTADTNIIIKRSRGQTDATLHVTGRDIKIESATALRWDALAGRWTAMGDAENFKGSEKRREIIEILEGSATGPMSPKQIADALGHPNTTNVRRLLFKMHTDKQVFRVGESLYSVPDAPAVTLC